MATWAEKTPAEQAIVKNYANQLRAVMGEMAKLFNHIKALNDDTLNALAILSTLDPAEVVPNSSGLAGSGELNAFEIGSFRQAILEPARQTIDLNNGTMQPVVDFRAKASKAAGINAMLG